MKTPAFQKQFVRRKMLIAFLLISYHVSLISQNIAINTTGSPANPSAMLDVNSTTGGLLPPRMTVTQMNAIASPAAGLMVFNSTTNCLEYYNGSAWQNFVCPCTSPPITPGSITGSTAPCVSSTGNVYSIAAVTGATSYTWSVPTGASITSGSGTTSITVTFSSVSGNIGVSAVNSCGISGANTQAITLTAIPAAPAVPSGTTTPTISTANTYTIAAVAGATSYTWSVSTTNGSVTAGQNTTSATITFSGTAGAMSICVYAGNTCGNSSSSCLSVTSSATCNNIIRTFAGTGTASFYGDGGAATSAELNSAIGVAVDPSGNIYIADQTNERIRKVNTSGNISTIAGTGTTGYNNDGIAATSAELSNPYGVAADASGNVYVADVGNQRIRKINTSGTISTYAGTGTGGYNSDGIAATSAELNNPYDVGVDASGNIYIGDWSNNRVRKVNTSGTISTFAGTGTGGYNSDGIAATSAELNEPFRVGADASGNIYIGEWGNQRIRKVNTSGIISTIAGTGTSGFSGDGSAATSAQISNPSGEAADAGGNVYIVDYGNQRIRKINTSGIISTFAGIGTSGYSGDGAAASSAELANPYGVTVDANGNVYIADKANNRIRVVSCH